MFRCHFAMLKNKHLHFQFEHEVPPSDFLFPALIDGSISKVLHWRWVDAGGRQTSKHVGKGLFLTSWMEIGSMCVMIRMQVRNHLP